MLGWSGPESLAAAAAALSRRGTVRIPTARRRQRAGEGRTLWSVRKAWGQRPLVPREARIGFDMDRSVGRLGCSTARSMVHARRVQRFMSRI
jgi:hypothetical protein